MEILFNIKLDKTNEKEVSFSYDVEFVGKLLKILGERENIDFEDLKEDELLNIEKQEDDKYITYIVVINDEKSYGKLVDYIKVEDLIDFVNIKRR